MIFLYPNINRSTYSVTICVLVILCQLVILLSAPSCILADTAKETLSDELPTSTLYSRSCALVDGYSGRLLYGKEEETPRANASTTKILTCILALENGNTEDMVTASERAVRQPKVRLGMKAGSEYRLIDLLYCLMLESYNDCAVAIAEHIAGSVEAFADMMNEKAKELGCTDSYFITPNGLDDKNENGNHHTTAYDLCQIMRYCAWDSPQKDQFLEITRKSSYSFTDGDGNSHQAVNHNQLLTTMEGALTGKTGFTADAGYCYVMAYEKEGKRFCAAFLACGWPNNKNYKWQDARKLIGFGEEHFFMKELYQPPELTPIEISSSCPLEATLTDWGKSVTIHPCLMKEVSEKIPYMVSEQDDISYHIEYDKPITAPVNEEDVIGCYEIDINDMPIRQYAIKAGEPAADWNFFRLFLVIFQEFCA